MKNQDIRYKIHLAYLSLVSAEDVLPINVRKLTETAGIARSTFYTYFDNIAQLVNDIENEFLYQFEKLYKQHIRCSFSSQEYLQFMLQIVNYLRTNYQTFIILCNTKESNGFIMKLTNIVKLLLVKQLNYLQINYSEVQLTFAATGFMSMTEFLNSNQNEKEIAQEYCNLFIQLFHETGNFLF